MKRVLTIVVGVLMTLLLAGMPARAGSPHFVSCSVTQNGNTLDAFGKEAGLGNEAQVHIVLTATAQCVNPGGNDPRAANKQTLSAGGDFPVQNGKALFSLSVTATFQPDCTPPMSVEFSNITVTDTTHGVSCTL